MAVRYPQVRVRLIGEDGNAHSILGRVRDAMRKKRIPESEIARYFHEATISDYDNLLRVTMEWVECFRTEDYRDAVCEECGTDDVYSEGLCEVCHDKDNCDWCGEPHHDCECED